MNADTICELIRRQPFAPFEIRMTNGDAHQIRPPANVLFAGGRIVVYHPEGDRTAILSLLHAATIEMLRQPQ